MTATPRGFWKCRKCGHIEGGARCKACGTALHAPKREAADSSLPTPLAEPVSEEPYRHEEWGLADDPMGGVR